MGLLIETVQQKILLIVDNSSSHPNINSDLSNIKLVFLPPTQQVFCNLWMAELLGHSKHTIERVLLQQ